MMTEYGKPLVEDGAKVAFLPTVVGLPLSRILSERNLRQLKVAESEKERFVTFYFNGQQSLKFSGEERIIIPSPSVATYDAKPEMAAREITSALLKKLRFENEYSFILINFANADMVAHSGNIGPTVTACEVVDESLGKLANFVLAYNGTLLITADHGNCENMLDREENQPHTQHTTNMVPVLMVNAPAGVRGLKDGRLSDVAPTLLSLLGLAQPVEMTGRSLIEYEEVETAVA